LVVVIEIIICGFVIELTEIYSFNTWEPADMILGMCGIQILSQLDDYFGQFYLKFFVLTSKDGQDAQKNDELLEYNELTLTNLQAVAIWCVIAVFLVFCQQLSMILSIFFPKHFSESYGWSFGSLDENATKLGFYFWINMYYFASIPILLTI